MADYTKLPVKKRGAVGISRLYLASDHLLSLESNTYTENYFRFYFTDIQAIVTRRSDRGTIWSILLGFLALLLTTCTVGAAAPPMDYSVFFWAPLAVAFLAIAGYNLYLGPTCETHIQTALGTHEIPALNRVKSAQRMLRRIKPLIDQAQGRVLTKEEIMQHETMPLEHDPSPGLAAPAPDTASGQLVVSAEAETTPQAPGVAGRYSSVKVHRYLFLSILLMAASNVLWVVFPGTLQITINIFATLLVLGFIIAALVSHEQGSVPSATKKLAWTAMVGLVAFFIIAYVIFIFYMARDISQAANPMAIYADLAENGTRNMPLLGYAEHTISVFFGAIGIFGLLSLAGAGSRRERTPTPPTPSAAG
jgi:hypothetical protein